MRGCFRFDGVVTIVDAVNGTATLDAQPEAVKQAAVADRIVLTKADLASEQQVETLRARLQVLNPGATLLSTADGEIAPDGLHGIGPFNVQGKLPDVTRWLNAEAYAAHTHGHEHERHEHEHHHHSGLQ